MAAIELRQIRKSFGETPVLQGVSLDIAGGEFLTLVGPSGCGKTTLLRIIAGLEFQDGGEVLIEGRAVDDLAPKRRDVAMVFQSYALYPYMTVAENMALPLVMRRMAWTQRLPLLGPFVPGSTEARHGIEREVASVAEMLAIGHLLRRRPAQLSGGQRQRVALGRAMVRHPRAFLMDEPLSNLDAKLRVHARAEIAQLHRRLGTTFVYVTHDQTEAMTMSDRVAVMMNGHLLQVARPQTIYDDPETLDVARFVGTPEINVLPARVRGDGALEVLGRVWPLQAETEADNVHVAIRPEAWGIQAGEAHPDRPSILGRVQHLELLGSETLVHVGVEGAAKPVVARVDPGAGAARALGELVTLIARPERVLVFDKNGTRTRIRHAAPVARLLAVHG